MAKKQQEEIIEKIINESLDIIMSNGFSRYSKYIIQQRALPDARDGLKPVQRRILFSMWEMSLTNDKPFKKSARVVGDVIGRFHPHGDSSIYEALIRMSQEWKMALPVVEMHGNKGSIDDDPAAAMRYTETRLEKIALPLIGEIDKKIVPFAPNFDDSEYEPVVLPTLFPNLLANGAKGIAEGYATEIPPHNLKELLQACVFIIQNPAASDEELLKIIKGPDFPTGGIISDLEGFKEAFKTGKGRVSIYSKTNLIKNKNDEVEAIEVTEIPYSVVKIELIKQIDNLIFTKAINGIKEVRDQSSRNGISIYIELEKDVNAEAILNYLFQKTDLRKYYNYNMVSICNNAPKLQGIKPLLNIFLDHLDQIKTLSLRYDFEKLSRRLEIVEGLIRVSEISDAVIKTIRESDNSKKGVIEALIKVFNFTELQATAIAELRLYKLSRMDQEEYRAEKYDLESKIARISLLLNNRDEFKKYLISILEDISTQYAIPRRSLISHEKIETELDIKDLAKNEDFYVFVSVDGYIKRVSQKIYNLNNFSTFNLKDNDTLQFFQEVNSLSKLLFFTSQGNYFTIDAFNIKENNWKDIGNHLGDYVRLDNNEKIIKVINIENLEVDGLVLLVSKQGLAKKIDLRELSNQSSRRLSAIKLKQKDDEVVTAQLTNETNKVFVLLNNGLYQYFDQEAIPVYSLKASGIQMTKLSDAQIFKVLCVNENDSINLVNSLGEFKKINLSEVSEVKRQNQPKILYLKLKNKDFEIIDVSKHTKLSRFWYVDQENILNQFNTESLSVTSPKDKFSLTKISLKNGRFISDFVLRQNDHAPKMQNIDKNENNDVNKEKPNSEPKNKTKSGGDDWLNFDDLFAKANTLKKNNDKK
ncbi:DNA topoisomerase IV subunit A [[Mycoplasma] gypis]|uniref:DNA topoisomerase (ATP-hydrolyzing) n=1 Tax=[Mycoplasma] gypis TaxID=92404 RepID=A0ABZ2RNK8_9BACT|nr:DNA topoisomerase IV subunit A [[Mycoplasma] gypis]MBN0919227.1 DNA topoisomerase IV subunit A [[Mycoplasma] gypis]